MGGHVVDTCVVIDLKAAGLLHVAAHSLARPAVGYLAARDGNELASHVEELLFLSVPSGVHDAPSRWIS